MSTCAWFEGFAEAQGLQGILTYYSGRVSMVIVDGSNCR
jgi:hypothetical protein